MECWDNTRIIRNEPFTWIPPIDTKANNVYSDASGIVYHTNQPFNSFPKPDNNFYFDDGFEFKNTKIACIIENGRINQYM